MNVSRCERHYVEQDCLLFHKQHARPLRAVMRCERARAGHTQQHCLQTPGRDDVTLHEHMFRAYARAFPDTRSLLYRNDVCWTYERCSVCSLRKGWFSRLKRGKKRVCFHDLHTQNTRWRRWGLWGNQRLQTRRAVKHGVDFSEICSRVTQISHTLGNKVS